MAGIRLAGTTDELMQAQRFLVSWWQDHQLAEAGRFPFDLALEELFVNIATHGRSRSIEAITVQLSLAATIEGNQAEVTMTVSDNGEEFNPTKGEAPDTDATLHERTVGGMGLHLTRTVMDVIHYRHDQSCNVTTVSKSFNNSLASAV